VTIVQKADVVLARLGAARTPWLAVALAGRARLAPMTGDAVAGDATVIDIADPQAVPLMVNPLEPGPGQVQAHADRLGGLFEAAFGLADPVAAALRAGLRRAYADGGWDLRTGWDPRAGRDPAVPSFRQVRLATVAAADELGYGPGLRSAVQGFLAAKLDALWAGPAGRFLEGGHPADLARLLRGNVLVTSHATADQEAASFLAGVLLLRLAEWLSHHPAPLTVVVATPGETGLGASPRGAAWFGRLLENLRLCTGYELHAADVLAEDDAQAWLRLWVQTLVLAFLTGRPCPGCRRRP
jgi:hypothetical protein